jgi:soluble lytic murein transglycosylase-like protein
MKLKLLKLINKVSYNIWKWSVREIDSHVPLKKPRYLYVQDFLILAAVIIFGVLTYFAYAPRNIQDVKPKVKIEKKEKKIENKEYEKMKGFFPWLNEKTYQTILIESEKKEIDYRLVMSVIQYESGDYCGNNWECMTKVVSRAGARGPMQIMPFHAPNPDDLFKPEYNIKKGVWYLSACLEASGGNIRDAARRYNQGIHGNPRKYRNWRYVKRIARKYKKVLTENVMAVNYEN